jgi:hypothetical protein
MLQVDNMLKLVSQFEKIFERQFQHSFETIIDGGAWANPNSSDKEFTVIPSWQQNWHIDGWPK